MGRRLGGIEEWDWMDYEAIKRWNECKLKVKSYGPDMDQVINKQYLLHMLEQAYDLGMSTFYRNWGLQKGLAICPAS